MKALSKNAFYALAVTALMTACNRPVATYQNMPVERFTSHKTVTTPEVEAVNQTPELATAPARITNQEVIASPAQPADVAAATKSLDEAVASAESKVAGNKKLEKRMAHVRTMLAEVSSKATSKVTNVAASAKKSSLAERMMLKKLDKKVTRAMAPESTKAPKAVNLLVTIGAIVALVGLILWLATTANGIGIVLLIVGVVLLLLGLIV